MRILVLAVLLAILTACSHAPAHSQHGHGHGHSHGNPADLEEYIAGMEAPDRAEWQKPDEVVKKLALEPGATACDIGSGPGYFSIRLGKAVGDGGVVYAVDVEPKMLSLLRERVEQSGTRNVIPVLGLMDDPLIPAAACDVVLIVNTFHHFSDPAAYLQRLKRSLKPEGRIVNIDFHKRPTPMGPRMEMRVERADFLAIAEKAGLAPAAEHDLLPHQYFIELKAKR